MALATVPLVVQCPPLALPMLSASSTTQERKPPNQVFFPNRGPTSLSLTLDPNTRRSRAYHPVPKKRGIYSISTFYNPLDPKHQVDGDMKSAFKCFSQVDAGVKFPRINSLSFPSRGWGSLLNTFPVLPKWSNVEYRSCMRVKASKDVPFTFRYPQMTKKPRWWWRTLACITYLMPLHEISMYAETAYHLHPFLEDFEFLTYPFIGVLRRLPIWFLMAYLNAFYLGVVRRKEWPHFFRFHVMMGMLLEITLQTIGFVNSWLPNALYWGKFGMHCWTALAFAFLFTVLECMRCALAGMYADVPFLCDAAYINIPHD